ISGMFDQGRNFVDAFVAPTVLHAAGIVVGRDFRRAFDDVVAHQPEARFVALVKVAPGLGLGDAMTDRSVAGGGTGLEVVADDVEHGSAVAAVGRTVTPVEEHVVANIDLVTPAAAGIARRVARPEIVMNRRAATADGGAEGVVVEI